MKQPLIVVAALCVLGVARPAPAQVLADGPVVYGHHHLYVSNVDATKKFLVEGLGGTAVRIGEPAREVIRFPNVLVFMNATVPKGGSKGTTVDHIGFGVRNMREAVDRVKAAGFRMVTSTETGPPRVVKDDIAFPPAGQTGNSIAFAMGPDDLKVELVETPQQAAPVALHHVHFFGQQNNEMQAWYAKTFGGEARQGANFPSVVLPAVSLNFSPSQTPVVGTKDRAIDHIGFEVRDLEAFLKKLAASGVKITSEYRKVPALNTAIAYITDPWGTYIELTEGLGRVTVATN
ncbi:MAG: VOC family protein [Acidimicrobiia bacterium]|nr:VOC family protein [Acidimicrobiia bacterium]